MLVKLKQLLSQDLVNNIIHTYSSRILLIILGLVSSIIITKNLGVENYGTYTLTLTLIALGTQLGNFGIHSANLFYSAKKKMLLGMLLKNSILFSMISGCTIGVLILLIYIVFPNLLKVDGGVLIIGIIIIPLSLISLFTKNLLIGIGKIKLDNKIAVFTRTLTICLLLLTIFLFGLNTYNALIIFAAGLMVGVFFILKELKQNVIYRNKLSAKLFKKISGFGLKAYFSVLFAFLVLKSDLFFVNYYLSKSELGYYSLAVRFIDYIYVLPVVIGTVLFQKLSSIKDNQQKFKIMKKLSLSFISLYACFLVLIYFTSGFIITTLFGDEFFDSVIIINILLIAIFFMAINTIVQQYLATTGFPKQLVYFWLASLILNISLNIAFIEQFGLYAVAFSTVVSYFLISFLSILRIKKQRK